MSCFAHQSVRKPGREKTVRTEKDGEDEEGIEVGKKRKEQQDYQDWDEAIIPSLDCGCSGFKMYRRNRGELHRAVAKGDHQERDVGGSLHQYVTEYSEEEKEADVSLVEESVVSVVSGPLSVGDTELALGASAPYKEGQEEHHLINQAAGDSGKARLTTVGKEEEENVSGSLQICELEVGVGEEELEEKMEAANTGKWLAPNIQTHGKTEGVPSGESLTSMEEDMGKSQNKRRLLIKRISHKIYEKLHLLQKDRSLSEASSEEEKHGTTPSAVNKTKPGNESQRVTKRISQQITEKLHQVQYDTSFSEVSLEEVRFSLKKEKENRICFEQLYEKAQKQLITKDQQYCALEVENQQLEFMLRNRRTELKTLENNLEQLRGLEEWNRQSERHIHDMQNALDAKKRDSSATCQRLQSLLGAVSIANKTIKYLKENVKRLETENKSLEAKTNQQSNKIEMLHKNLQDQVSVHIQLEKEISGLQNEKTNLQEQVNALIQKQSALSVMAQDTRSTCEKPKPRPKVHFSELDREKEELRVQLEKERRKVKKLAELKQSIAMQLDQETQRNSELEKKCYGFKVLLKTTKEMLKDYESRRTSSQARVHNVETGTLQKESFIYSPHLGKEAPKHDNATNFDQMEQYKSIVKEQAKQEVRQKLEEVNLFLQTQAASQESLEQLRANSDASFRNQLGITIKGLESEITDLKSRLQDCALQNESALAELKSYKDLYLEESKRRTNLANKLTLSNAKLAEAKGKLSHERGKSKSLLASGFISGSLSTSPLLETIPLGNLTGNLAFSSPNTPGGGFRNPTESPLATKRRVEAYMGKMQGKLEKYIKKELEEAERPNRFGRASLKETFDGCVEKLSLAEDQVANATQYLDVLNKNYML